MSLGVSGPTTQASHGVRIPTAEEMKRAYAAIVQRAAEAGTMTRLSGPPVPEKQLEKWPRYDITPDGLMDVSRTVWEIRGKLYLQTSSLFGPGGQPHSIWQLVGPAPLF